MRDYLPTYPPTGTARDQRIEILAGQLVNEKEWGAGETELVQTWRDQCISL